MSNINIANKKWNILLDRAFRIPSRLRVKIFSNALQYKRVSHQDSTHWKLAPLAACHHISIFTEYSFDEISAMSRFALHWY